MVEGRYGMKKIIAFILTVSLFVLPLVACAPIQRASHSVTYIEGYFHTECTIQSYAGDTRSEFDKIQEICRDYLSRYNKLLDKYFEYADVVNIMTLNKEAKNGPVEVSRELFDFLKYCKEIYTITTGETNVAMGAVLELWHDAREAEEKYLPSSEDLLYAAEHTSIDDLVLDEDNLTVYFSDPELSLDVGAVGKGYVAQLLKDKLEDMGVSGYVLNIGRNLCFVGERVGGYPFGVKIINPDLASSQKYIMRVEVADTSLVTSGDYENYFTFDGENYHHIIDKDTLLPSTHFSSVSIITDDSALADALSTALFCMTYEEGLALIEELGDVEALWVRRNGEILKSAGFDDYIA